ncbi:family 16 glycoside hydrolase [Agriterribacter sp.]|uniref:family 16 glycoside hydrolase n=1 Tax=Agriterribacter sp. TaxID=2821509 RepID=UPI002B76B68E|nr:family 16 glycoside hydrolase [Agriterribacter sp.]HTN07557.1 family 16 glycoside hydrolase [Agriterribacter sp.]
MKKNIFFLTAIVLLTACSSQSKIKDSSRGSNGKQWISLFDGKSMDGWKESEGPSFSIENGAIKVAGKRSHLYYDGPVNNHNFKNFEVKMQVMTTPNSNSGVYFHTKFQQKGFPDDGFEVQVNNSHTDWKRTAGLYDIHDTAATFVKDNVWFELSILVKGKHVVTKINGQTIIDWTEPEGAVASKGHPGRLISSGTFALQAHDPKSVVYYKDIMVKPLP